MFDPLKLTHDLRVFALWGVFAAVLFFVLNQLKTWQGWARFAVSLHFGLFYLSTLLQPQGYFILLPFLSYLASPEGAPLWGAMVGFHFAWTLAGISFIQWLASYVTLKTPLKTANE